MFERDYIINSEYIASHPNMTLKEYLDERKNIELKEKEENDEREKKESEYFKSLKDKYFIINFNSSSYLIVYVDKEIRNNIDRYPKFHCYNIVYWGNNRFEFKEETREFNILWFDNPYHEYNYSFGKPVQWCKEITKDEYDGIVNMLGSCKSVLNHIKDVSLNNK